MKKILSITLAVLLVATVFTGCGAAKTYKVGLGVYSAVTKATDAEADTNGAAEASVTTAVVIFDADGKIVNCTFDSLALTGEYTSKGAALETKDFKTKRELGANYGMSKSTYDVNGDGVVKEWFEQADIFATQIKGKTVDEVKALVAEGDRGAEEVQTAGCTIMISEFVLALEKAAESTKETEVSKDAALKIKTVATSEIANATADAEGSITYKVATTATADDTELAVADTEVKFAFDAKGAAVK